MRAGSTPDPRPVGGHGCAVYSRCHRPPSRAPERPCDQPFDIEEIYPDDGDRPVRLPRRQAGNSPQGVAVTLLADYTLRTRAWLPSAAIVALLAESGVSHGRRADRDQPAGPPRRAGGQPAGAAQLVPAQPGRRRQPLRRRQLGHRRPPPRPQPWDGWWTLVAFSLPQERSAQRRALRGQLRWLGYAPLYDGLWISPHELTPKARAQLAQLPSAR